MRHRIKSTIKRVKQKKVREMLISRKNPLNEYPNSWPVVKALKVSLRSYKWNTNIKIRKEHRLDVIPKNIFRYENNSLSRELAMCFNNFFNRKNTNRMDRITIRIIKKGSKRHPNNCRTVSLLKLMLFHTKTGCSRKHRT